MNQPMLITDKPRTTPARGVQVTERALAQIRARQASEKHGDGCGLRIAVLGGGCTGLNAEVEFDSPRYHDRLLNFDGIRLLVDPKSFIYVYGLILDYNETELPRGFVLLNSVNSNACGCGTVTSPGP